MASSSAPRKRTKKALMKNAELANSDDDNELDSLCAGLMETKKAWRNTTKSTTEKPS